MIANRRLEVTAHRGPDLDARSTESTYTCLVRDSLACPPGMAVRAFGLSRLTSIDQDGYFRDISGGYFDRRLIQADRLHFPRSVFHAQPAGRDNIFLGSYVTQPNPSDFWLDFYQLEP